MKQGKITTNGVVLREHENATVVFLTQQGYDVELIPTSYKKGIQTPDIRMIDLYWEMKCPTGNSANTIKRAFKSALKQSQNLIFDLRKSRTSDSKNITKLEKEFTDIKSVRRLIIITKSRKLLDLKKTR